MRIGFDGSCLTNRRGFGRFSRRMLEAVARSPSPHEFVVVIDRLSEPTVAIPANCGRVAVDVGEAPGAAASAQGRRRLRDMLAMGRAVARARLDLMYFPATYTFFPVWNVPRLVVTMHDTLALAHPELVFPSRQGRLAWLLKEHAAAILADRIVTVSETSRRDLQAWFQLPADRFRVVSEGPDQVFRPSASDSRAEASLRRYAIPSGAQFVLYVGGLSPHKNLLRLIQAFGQIRHKDVLLVLVGDFHDLFHTHIPEIRAAIETAEVKDRVLLPGYVPDDELVHLYSRAYSLIQPSLMEGFGLPAVEAMACGTPVISSKAGSLPEVVGDAGLFFDPRDVSSIRTMLEELLSDQERRNELAARALVRAARFTWDRAARSLIDCFEEFDASGQGRSVRPSGRPSHRQSPSVPVDAFNAASYPP